jgi:hypothetical protein
VDVDATGHLLIIYSAFVKYLKKKKYYEAVYQLFTGFKNAYDSVTKEVLYNILTESGISLSGRANRNVSDCNL